MTSDPCRVKPTPFLTALTATASVGATIAPRAMAAATGIPAAYQPRKATVAVVITTAPTANANKGTHSRIRSRGAVS